MEKAKALELLDEKNYGEQARANNAVSQVTRILKMEMIKKRARRNGKLLGGKNAKDAKTLRFAKEKTSSGQAQALWGFLVAVGVFLTIFFSLHQPQHHQAVVTQVTTPAPSESALIPSRSPASSSNSSFATPPIEITPIDR